jgi:hypothetical protein
MKTKASRSEKPKSLERAIVGEESNAIERANSSEKTNNPERASVVEKTTRIERATCEEKPRARERARTYEKTTVKERATVEEETSGGKRASIVKETRANERANPGEEPSGVERLSDPVRQSLSVLVRAYYDYQRERLGLDGRLGQKKDGSIKKGIPERDEVILLSLMERRQACVKMEEDILKDIAKTVKTHPLWKHFLKGVKGCGEAMATVIITEFDINKAPTVSNLWSFAGLAPGKDRKVKGQKCPYNQFLRAKLCGVLGSSFLKCGSPYAEFYYDMKHRLESKDWGTPSKNPTDKSRPKAGHQHKAATRYMVKQFLKDLYVAWRTLEGLPVREPYAEEYLGKKHSA